MSKFSSSVPSPNGRSRGMLLALLSSRYSIMSIIPLGKVNSRHRYEEEQNMQRVLKARELDVGPGDTAEE